MSCIWIRILRGADFRCIFFVLQIWIINLSLHLSFFMYIFIRLGLFKPLLNLTLPRICIIFLYLNVSFVVQMPYEGNLPFSSREALYISLNSTKLDKDHSLQNKINLLQIFCITISIQIRIRKFKLFVCLKAI